MLNIGRIDEYQSICETVMCVRVEMLEMRNGTDIRLLHNQFVRWPFNEDTALRQDERLKTDPSQPAARKRQFIDEALNRAAKSPERPNDV